MLMFPVETFEDVHHSTASTSHFVHLCDTNGAAKEYVMESRDLINMLSGCVRPNKDPNKNA